MPADNDSRLIDVRVGRARRGERTSHEPAPGPTYRAVHIFVFNSRGELLLRQVSAGSDEYSLCYTSSASGHLAAGEEYDVAAARELHKALGLVAPLELIASFAAGPDTAHEHTRLYRARTDDQPVPDACAVESIEFVDLERLSRRIFTDQQRFAQPFRLLFGWYRRHARQWRDAPP
jgi:16S rRNA (adenine1518-N6/adenine1519-N6)-dimethyltransferase